MSSRQKPPSQFSQTHGTDLHVHMPSFSSTLLDQIYRSIDANKSNDRDRDLDLDLSNQDSKEITELRRRRLVENWMRKEQGRNRKVILDEPKSLQQDKDINDVVFFSSTSSSSDSSGALSSSDTEFFGATKDKVSCFTTRPKPVRTRKNVIVNNPQEEFCGFADKKRVQEEELMMKSKSRALKIYANLKKMKQPISPGGKLTTLINSLFSNGKSKNGEPKSSSKISSSSSTCSSASSFSRSCLSKYSPKSREKMREGGSQRTVRFHPVSVIVDEDSRPCGHKSIYDQDSRPPLPLPLSRSDKNRKLEEVELAVDALKSYYSKKKDLKGSLYDNIDGDGDEDDDDDDVWSDSSSDLFELDHLSLFGDRHSRYCEQLPVYETTQFHKNHGLMC